jgi:uncharacterized protein YbjT (DUF2867 family)
MKLSKVLVFGATGAQGSPVAKLLIEKGNAVRAASRDATRAAQLYGPAVEAIAADLADVESLKRAFDGVDAAFFHMPLPKNVADIPVHLNNALQAAREAALPRLVFTTSGTTDERLAANPMVAGNLAAASAVLSSGVPAVVLKPTMYLQNLLQPQNLSDMLNEGVLRYPPLQSARKISWTALEDQAAFAVAALTEEKAVGRAFQIASPEPVDGTRLTALLSEKIGREIRFEPPTPEEFGAVIAGFYGKDAGDGIAGLYRATDALPLDATIVDLTEALEILPVALTPVSEWINRQNWSL